VAALLAALAFGRARVQRALSPIVRPLPWIGLAVAAASGLVAVARGASFLTHYHAHAAVSRHVTLDISTTLLFDVGVYLVVVGASSMILGAFAEAESP
jgi:multisubunit Na+/H+ antiporter MnhB subunit